LETRMGEDSRAIGIGMVLLLIAFIIIVIINVVEKRSYKYDGRIQIT
jgi:ABC-type sulfate transport system permease component